jgi:hypothetical protein
MRSLKKTLSKFKDGEKLYAENHFFKVAVDHIVAGSSVYDVLKVSCMATKQLQSTMIDLLQDALTLKDDEK